MDRDCIFEDSYVYDLHFDLMKGKLDFSAFDEEENQMHKVIINGISKIFWDIDSKIDLEEQAWILYQLAVRDTHLLKQTHKKFWKRKIKYDDDWLSDLIQEYELNIAIEFGCCLECTLKAKEIVLDGEKYQL